MLDLKITRAMLYAAALLFLADVVLAPADLFSGPQQVFKTVDTGLHAEVADGARVIVAGLGPSLR